MHLYFTDWVKDVKKQARKENVLARTSATTKPLSVTCINHMCGEKSSLTKKRNALSCSLNCLFSCFYLPPKKYILYICRSLAKDSSLCWVWPWGWLKLLVESMSADVLNAAQITSCDTHMHTHIAQMCIWGRHTPLLSFPKPIRNIDNSTSTVFSPLIGLYTADWAVIPCNTMFRTGSRIHDYTDRCLVVLSSIDLVSVLAAWRCCHSTAHCFSSTGDECQSACVLPITLVQHQSFKLKRVKSVTEGIQGKMRPWVRSNRFRSVQVRIELGHQINKTFVM